MDFTPYIQAIHETAMLAVGRGALMPCDEQTLAALIAIAIKTGDLLESHPINPIERAH